MRTKSHQNTEDLADAYDTLTQAGIVNPRNFEMIKRHREPKILLSALLALHRKEILTQDNFDAIINHHAPLSLATALRVLKRANILTPDNRDVIRNHEAIGDLVDALRHMYHKKRMLNQKIFHLIHILMQKAPTIQQQRDWPAFRKELEKIEHPFAWFLLGKLSCSECWYIDNEGHQCAVTDLYDPNKALSYFNKIPTESFFYTRAQKSISNIHQTKEDCKSANLEVEKSENPQRQVITKRSNEHLLGQEDSRGGKRQRKPSGVNKRIASQAALPQRETGDERPRSFSAASTQTLFSPPSFHEHNVVSQGGNVAHPQKSRVANL